MKKQTIFIFITILFSTYSFTQTKKNEKSEIDKAFIDWKDSTKPGLAAGVIKDGKVIYLEGFGSANMETKTKITPQTKFQLGELSKQFTTLAILLLEKQGKISLQDDIRKYLKQLPKYKHTITIEHLLNHSSGLYGVNQVNNMINGSTNITTQKKALKLIASQKTLSYKPGTNFSFHESVTESILMAEIVARSSKKSFSDFVKTNIFEPLEMKNSLIRDHTETILVNVAEPYQKEKGKNYKKRTVNSNVVGAINGYTSAEDLAKWYLNFSNPKGSLGHLIQKLDTPVKLTNGKKFSYYWGEMVIGREFTHPERGLPIFWTYGLQGGYSANVFRYVNQNIISFVLGNGNQYNGSVAMNAIMPFVKDLYLNPEVIDYSKLKTKKLSTKELKSFEGNYWFKKAGYATKIFLKNDTLHNQWIFTKRSQKLIPISNNIFQAIGNNEDVRLYNFQKKDDNTTLFFTYNESEADIMEKYKPVKPSKESLKDFVGTFYNTEYAALFSFYIEDGQITAQNLNHEPIKFKPVKKDVFTSTSTFFNSLEFIRDKSNKIKGFKINTDGIHNLVFNKATAIRDLNK